MKNSSDIIGNRTRDLPTCSAVPQPTAPPRAAEPNNNNDNNNNKSVNTSREVIANRPDIIIKNKEDKTGTLIDVAILADRNVVQKEAEKI